MFMKVNIYDINGKVVAEEELPKVFSTEYHPNLIRRAVIAIETAKLQPKGPNKKAGRDYSAETRMLRSLPFMDRTINTSRARLPRLKNERHLLQGNVALVPQAVKGTRAHPPKPEKILEERIKKKEKKKATFSALAATANKELVRQRGHKFDESLTLPIVVEDSIESLKKTKEVVEMLKKLKIYDDVEKAKEKKKIRAGKGKMRGRKYKRRKSILFICSKKCDLVKAARNLEGVDIITVNDLNAKVLAPGGVAGRLAVISKPALEIMKGW